MADKGRYTGQEIMLTEKEREAITRALLRGKGQASKEEIDHLIGWCERVAVDADILCDILGGRLDIITLDEDGGPDRMCLLVYPPKEATGGR